MDGRRPAPPVAQVEGFTIVDRVTRVDRPHPMIARNGEPVEAWLRQCSLYDPQLDLAVEDAEGTPAGYALFWFDDTTLVGLLEPMRVEDEYQRRGLARMLLTNGLDRLARKGARRLKVGFETDAARNLYVGAGFVQTSVDRRLIRAAPQRLEHLAVVDRRPALRAEREGDVGFVASRCEVSLTELGTEVTVRRRVATGRSMGRVPRPHPRR